VSPPARHSPCSWRGQRDSARRPAPTTSHPPRGARSGRPAQAGVILSSLLRVVDARVPSPGTEESGSCEPPCRGPSQPSDSPAGCSALCDDAAPVTCALRWPAGLVGACSGDVSCSAAVTERASAPETHRQRATATPRSTGECLPRRQARSSPTGGVLALRGIDQSPRRCCRPGSSCRHRHMRPSVWSGEAVCLYDAEELSRWGCSALS
jgi:hypothetical protein